MARTSDLRVGDKVMVAGYFGEIDYINRLHRTAIVSLSGALPLGPLVGLYDLSDLTRISKRKLLHYGTNVPLCLNVGACKLTGNRLEVTCNKCRRMLQNDW